MESPADAEFLEIDEGNEEHVTAHGVSVMELQQVFGNGPRWVPNKKGRTATFLMVGRTNGERPIVAAVIYDEIRRVVRPITSRRCEDHEVKKWL
jgi:uncharacterized DUF497 family protein